MFYIIEHTVFQCFKVTPLIISLYIIINSTLVYSMVYKYLMLYKFIKSYKNAKDPTIEQIQIDIKKKMNELSKLDESTLSLENWVYEV